MLDGKFPFGLGKIKGLGCIVGGALCTGVSVAWDGFQVLQMWSEEGGAVVIVLPTSAKL